MTRRIFETARLPKADRGIRTRALALASHLVERSLPEGVFMYHQGRCGSTVLAQLLAQHPAIATFDEIFETPFHRGRLKTSADAVLRAIRMDARPAHALVEAKFMECQHIALLKQTVPRFVETVRGAGYPNAIVLNRRNTLRKVVSAELGRLRGERYHYAVGETVPQLDVVIDTASVRILGKRAPIVELFDYIDEQYEKLRAALAGDDVLELVYEDHLASDPSVGYRMTLDWLGLDPHPAAVPIQRTNTRPLAQVVRNWDAVADALAGTRHAWMLREEEIAA